MPNCRLPFLLRPPLPQLPDDCDSNFARAIQASLDDARAQQQQQQQPQQAGGGGGGESAAAPAAAAGEAVLDSTAVAADPNRPSDAAIVAWENEIK